MQRFSGRFSIFAIFGLVLLLGTSSYAQYASAYLTSNQTGKAKYTDPLLQNAWGIAYSPGNPFWVNDEADGWSTLYNAQGQPQSLQVVVPPASGAGSGTPTGIAYNGSTQFKIDSWTSVFLFATLDGTIQGWSDFEPNQTLIGVTSAGASYTGLAITSHTSNNFVFAADAANNKVDIYDGNFNLVSSFKDPAIPAGFAPFGIQDINGQVYITYASTSGGPGGYIDIMSESGTLVKHFAHGSPLNQPWGIALAPSNFGTLSNTILVSNNTSAGTINGFNATTGKFVGTIKTTAGKTITIPGLWGIEFGGGSTANGQKNQLFFAAGPNDTNGYFGTIVLK